MKFILFFLISGCMWHPEEIKKPEESPEESEEVDLPGQPEELKEVEVTKSPIPKPSSPSDDLKTESELKECGNENLSEIEKNLCEFAEEKKSKGG